MRLKPVISPMALIAVLAVSCVKTERLPDGAEDRYPITFTTAVGSIDTKAMIEGNVFPTDEEFATFAYWLKEGGWDDNKNAAQLYIPLGEADSRTVVSYDETLNCWSTEIPYYWPHSGSLTFFAFHPYDMDDVTFSVEEGITIAGRDIAGDKDQQKDIMVAEAAKDQTANSAPGENGNLTRFTGVPTVFHHTMSRVVGFHIRTDEDYTSGAGDYGGTKLEFLLNSIKIKNVFVKASFKSGPEPDADYYGEWFDYSGADAVYSWYDNDNDNGLAIVYCESATDEKTKVPDDNIRIKEGDNTESKLAGSALILPQRFNDPYADNHDACIELTYTVRYKFPDKSEKSRRIVREISLAEIHRGQDSSWPMGKDISYSFTIGLDRILWEPELEDRETEIYGDDL